MTNSKRTTLGVIGLALGLVALMLILILTALHAAMDAASAAGISDDDLRMLDSRLAAYLAGDKAALNEGDGVVEIPVRGAVQPAFNEKEMTHMADCFRLFALLRKVRSRLIPWAVLLIVGGAYLLQNQRKDFDGAFTFFHRVLFSNDLWLLNPATDLLIRICPESMFMGMGLRIGLWGLAALVAVPALATLITFIWPKNKQDEANKWNDNRATRRASAQRPKTFDFGEKH